MAIDPVETFVALIKSFAAFNAVEVTGATKEVPDGKALVVDLVGGSMPAMNPLRSPNFRVRYYADNDSDLSALIKLMEDTFHGKDGQAIGTVIGGVRVAYLGLSDQGQHSQDPDTGELYFIAPWEARFLPSP